MSARPREPLRAGSRALRVLAGLASGAVLAVTVAAGSATVAADRLAGNFTSIDISDQVGSRPTDPPEDSSGPMTIVLMGSDARTGAGNEGYGQFDGARSDTTMVAHLYPDRRSAVVVSIPRDTIVNLPPCVAADGTVHAATRARFNEAFDRGGPGCTVKTVEQLTGLTVDHFAVLDFNGFKRTIDALGGVEVCLNHPLKDEKSKIDLPAGRTRVSGEQALAFVRVRHNIGDGSDIGRINRQQLFLSSLFQEVTGSGLLTDPVRLWRVLRESSQSVATDPGLADSQGLLQLATSLVGLRPAQVTFVTLPWVPNSDGATVVPDGPRAEAIWSALRTEQPWPPPPTRGVDGQPLTVVPGQVRVSVRNATGTEGQATRAGDALVAQGFALGRLDAAERPTAATTISYGPDALDRARTLQAAVPGAVLREDATRGDTLLLTLGTSYRGVSAIRVKAPRASGTVTAEQDICTG